MNESKEITGYGAHVLRSWEEIRKAGGEAPSIERVDEYLEKPQNGTLTREELEWRIKSYFGSLIVRYEDTDTGQTGFAWKSAPTKSGLSMAIGVSSFTLSRYLRGRNCKGEMYNHTEWGHRGTVSPDDFDLIERAATIIESFYESNLGKNMNNSGSIFWLKNRTNEHWHDEQDINLTANKEDDVPHMTREEIAARYAAYKEIPDKLEID